MTMPVQAGQEGARGKHMSELAKSGPLEKVTGVWGGYQDAGDWDTLGGHLSATYDLLGLYELNPQAFSRIKLALPGRGNAEQAPRHTRRSHVADAPLAGPATGQRRGARRIWGWWGCSGGRDEFHAQ